MKKDNSTCGENGQQRQQRGNTPGVANARLDKPTPRRATRVPTPTLLSEIETSQNCKYWAAASFQNLIIHSMTCAIYNNNNVHAEAMYLRAKKKRNVPLRETCFHITGLHAFKWL